MSPAPKPKRITAHADKLLNGLNRRRNQWLTRSDVAVLIGKKRLTPYDIDLLELMAEQGLIRVEKEDGYSREGFRWIYGVFDAEHDGTGKRQGE